MRRCLSFLIVVFIAFAGCTQKAHEPPRVFGPNELRPKLLFVGDWKPGTHVFLNVQLEVAKADCDGPPTLTNAEVNEDFFPAITAIFFKDDEKLARQELSSERSC